MPEPAIDSVELTVPNCRNRLGHIGAVDIHRPTRPTAGRNRDRDLEVALAGGHGEREASRRATVEVARQTHPELRVVEGGPVRGDVRIGRRRRRHGDARRRRGERRVDPRCRPRAEVPEPLAQAELLAGLDLAVAVADLRRCCKIVDEDRSGRRVRVRDHERVILIGCVGVPRNPVTGDVGCAHIDRETPTRPRGQEDILDVVSRIGRSPGHRLAIGEDVALVGGSTGVNDEIEIIDERVSGQRPGSVSPCQRQLQRLGQRRDREGTSVRSVRWWRNASSGRRTRDWSRRRRCRG